MKMTRKVMLPLLFVGLLIAGASFFSLPVHAQSASTTNSSGAATAAPPSLAGNPPSGSAGGCSALDPTTWGHCILDAVATAVLAFANFLLGVAGVLFNLVMFYGVFQFANIIGNSPGVLTAWGILRDLANMALLFGFIFMGIATILDTGAVQSFTAKRALPALLIFAILMNFSLFTAEAVIDVSNALSSSIYAQANTDPCTGQSDGTTLTAQDCGISYGLAGHIMQSTGLAGIWAVKDNTSIATDATTYLGLALFATIGAVVFFAASIMLAIRVITLTFLMVVSPIGFAGMAIPPLRKFAGDWWTRVIHQAFYAPIMLLLILISLKIADSFTSGAAAGINNGLGNSSLATAVIQQDTSVMGVMLVFMLVIGFLVASLIVANKFGAAGASFAVKTAGRMTYGTLGAVGRNTAGRTFYNINDRIRKSEFGQTRIGRGVALMAEKGSKASYDVRGTKLGDLSKKIKAGDLGTPVKDGYAGGIKTQTEAYSNYAKTLKQTDAAKEKEKQLKNKISIIAESRKMENERWNSEKKERTGEIDQLNKDIAARQKERDSQTTRVNAAITSGNQEAYRRETSLMGELMKQHADLDIEANKKLQEATSELEKAQEQHEGFIKEFDNEMVKTNAEIKGDIDKGSAGFDSESSKRAFALGLKNSRLPGNVKAREKAAEAIKLELNKSKTEKALDGLKASIDSNKDDTGHKLEEVKGVLEAEGDKPHEGGEEESHH